MGISFTSNGSFDNTEKWLKNLSKGDFYSGLDKYGQMGVEALRAATPVDEGVTAASWTYEIVRQGSSYSIIWSNTHVVEGQPIAILLQYGHGTGTGGYVQGRDYINPAIRPVFDRIEAEFGKAVSAR